MCYSRNNTVYEREKETPILSKTIVISRVKNEEKGVIQSNLFTVQDDIVKTPTNARFRSIKSAA